MLKNAISSKNRKTNEIEINDQHGCGFESLSYRRASAIDALRCLRFSKATIIRIQF